ELANIVCKPIVLILEVSTRLRHSSKPFSRVEKYFSHDYFNSTIFIVESYYKNSRDLCGYWRETCRQKKIR
ncbi:TPA: hypothetical protein ACJT8P_003055, partial [Legionella pneumophila]